MRKLVLGIVAAALLVALPAVAQSSPYQAITDGTVGGMIGGIQAGTADPITAGFIMTVVG
jgi:hypothetical protein